MEIITNDSKRILLLRIARHLIVNSSFLTDLGLYNGKMGGSLFFAHYSRYTEEMLYDDFAGELLDEIFEEINQDTSIYLNSGLCGIGWGIEYLLERNFMAGDPNEILLELDKKVMEHDLLRIENRSMEMGLNGIGCYIEKRLCSSHRNSNATPFDEHYLQDWNTIRHTLAIPTEEEFVSSWWQNIPEGNAVADWELGLIGGCAGAGLKLILT